MQLGLGHLTFQPEQQLVVEVMPVRDPVQVDDQRVCQAAQLKQTLEVRVRAPPSTYVR
jgi:hypothetical protein